MIIRILILLLVSPFLIKAQLRTEQNEFFYEKEKEILLSEVNSNVKEINFYLKRTSRQYKVKSKRNKLEFEFFNIDTIKFMKLSDTSYNQIMSGDTFSLIVKKNKIETEHPFVDSSNHRIKKYDSLHYKITISENKWYYMNYILDTISLESKSYTISKTLPDSIRRWSCIKYEFEENISIETQFIEVNEEFIPKQQLVITDLNDSVSIEEMYYFKDGEKLEKPCYVTTHKTTKPSQRIITISSMQINQGKCLDDRTTYSNEWEHTKTLFLDSDSRIKLITILDINFSDSRYRDEWLEEFIVEYKY